MVENTTGVTTDSGEDSGGLSTTQLGLIIAFAIVAWVVMVVVGLYCWCSSDKKKSKKSTRGTRTGRRENSDEEKIIGKPKKGKKKDTSTTTASSGGSVSIDEKVPVQPYVNQSVDSESASRTLPFNLMTAMEDAMRKTIESYVVDSKRLELKEKIGSGGFGMVYKGILLDKNLQNPKDVAVKTVHAERCTQESVSQFLQEVMRMKGFMHKNVLTMTGLVMKKNVPYVVLPFMQNGDLKSYLGKSEKEFLVKDLLEMGVQVADGMTYLSEQNFVHRDLAARNCMVDKNHVVKVADFGLSRDIFCDDYYVMEEANTPLPVKWMALESIKNARFSIKSDVWSFGVVLWEIITRGQQPYSGQTNLQVIRFVSDGNRLPEPPYSPPGVYKIMCRCWTKDSARRPSFAQISRELRQILAGASTQRKVGTKQQKDKKQYYNVSKK